jgi:hypothetical protein
MAIFANLKILNEKMHENMRCINYLPNLGQWIKSKGGSMAALELFFIHNLNIPCCASNSQQSINDAPDELEPLNPKNFGS